MKAQFHKNQRVYVRPVGTWAIIERVIPHWAKGIDEPLRVFYDVGLGREFAAEELQAEQPLAENTQRGAETWREHRAFATRPKTPGLWIKLVFRDQDSTEGLLANNLMLVEEAGFHIIPPDPTFQSQRIFVPRLALREVQVLGVIGSGLRRRKAARPDAVKGPDQIELF